MVAAEVAAIFITFGCERAFWLVSRQQETRKSEGLFESREKKDAKESKFDSFDSNPRREKSNRKQEMAKDNVLTAKAQPHWSALFVTLPYTLYWNYIIQNCGEFSLKKATKLEKEAIILL